MKNNKSFPKHVATKENGIFKKINNPDDRSEYIVCAAILCRDSKALSMNLNNGPTNIPSGKGCVITGHRHVQIIELIINLGFEAYGEYITKGFLTSKNKFVSRSVAAFIAHKSGQLFDDDCSILMSDDLY